MFKIESCICLDSIHKESDVTFENVKTIGVFFSRMFVRVNVCTCVCRFFSFVQCAKLDEGMPSYYNVNDEMMQKIKQMGMMYVWFLW